METRNSLQPQFCCWIELRVGCRCIGFIIIIESFILFVVHPAWDSHWNTIISIIGGSSLIAGCHTYQKRYLILSKCAELIHILYMAMVAISHFVRFSDLDVLTLFTDHSFSKSSDGIASNHTSENKHVLLGLGITYSICAIFHCYFWTCINRLYKRYRLYTFLRNSCYEM